MLSVVTHTLMPAVEILAAESAGNSENVKDQIDK